MKKLAVLLLFMSLSASAAELIQVADVHDGAAPTQRVHGHFFQMGWEDNLNFEPDAATQILVANNELNFDAIISGIESDLSITITNAEKHYIAAALVPGAQGITTRYTWAQLEIKEAVGAGITVSGTFDFTDMVRKADIMENIGKKMIPIIFIRSFNSTGRVNSAYVAAAKGGQVVPTDMHDDSNLTYTNNNDGTSTNEGMTTGRWRSEVQTRFASLMTEAETQLNDHAGIAGLTLQETATGLTTAQKTTTGYDATDYENGLIAIADDAGSKLDNKHIFMFLNFVQDGQLSDVADGLTQGNVWLSGPDILPSSLKSTYALYEPRKATRRIGQSMQNDSYQWGTAAGMSADMTIPNSLGRSATFWDLFDMFDFAVGLDYDRVDAYETFDADHTDIYGDVTNESLWVQAIFWNYRPSNGASPFDWDDAAKLMNEHTEWVNYSDRFFDPISNNTASNLFITAQTNTIWEILGTTGEYGLRIDANTGVTRGARIAVTDGSPTAYAPVGYSASDQHVKAVLGGSAIAFGSGIAVKIADRDNLYYAEVFSSGVRLRSRIATVEATEATIATANIAEDDVLELKVVGDQLTLILNNETLHTETITNTTILAADDAGAFANGFGSTNPGFKSIQVLELSTEGVTLTSIATDSHCDKFNVTQTPDIAIGDRLVGPDTVSPGGYLFTIGANCDMSYTDGGENLQQRAMNITIFDVTAGDFHADDIDFIANNNSPTCDPNVETIVYTHNVAITAEDLTDDCSDPDPLDTLTFTLTTGTEPTGLSLSGTGNKDLTGTPTVADLVGVSLTYTSTDDALATDTFSRTKFVVGTVNMAIVDDSDQDAANTDMQTLRPWLSPDNLFMSVSHACSNTEAVGQVISQVPAAGTPITAFEQTSILVSNLSPCGVHLRGMGVKGPRIGL